MRLLLVTLSLIGLLGCDSRKDSTSVGSTVPTSQNPTDGVAAKSNDRPTSSPMRHESDSAKPWRATNLEGVYIVQNHGMQEYIERVTGQSQHWLEILSDKRLWFTVKEGNAEPESFITGGGDENILTHQYFVSSTLDDIDWSVSEGDTVDFQLRVTHLESDKTTLSEALSMRESGLIETNSVTSMLPTFELTIPPIDTQLVDSLSVTPTGSQVGRLDVGHRWDAEADGKNDSLRLISIGRELVQLNEDHMPKLGGEMAWQSFISIGVQLEPAPWRGSRHLQALTKLGGELRGSTHDLSGTRITDEEVFHIRAVSKHFRVNTVDLSGTAVTDKGLKQLKELDELRELRLSNTQVTDAGVAELKQSLPNCKIVN